MKNVAGVFAPISTPFRDDEEVDYDALAFNVERYAASGLLGYLALGSNGENRSLTEEERLRVLACIIRRKRADQVVMAGAAYDAQRDTERFLKHAADLGADFGLVLSPGYFKKQMTDDARTDMLVATLALKYTQSNSVCLAYDGQTIGIGAGQQSRIACTRIACAKADKWLLRLHPKVRGLDLKKSITRTEKANAIDLYLEEDATEAELRAWRLHFNTVPEPLTREERHAWLARFDGVALSSDAFIPFRDNIDRAVRSGVRYVVQTGGSSRDEGIIRAADEYGMVMVFTGLRLFHH